MTPKPHFLALLTFSTTEDGGLKIPALSGYRPGIKFSFQQEASICIQQFQDTDYAFPGDVRNAEITLLDPENFKGRLYEGLDFKFFEGTNLIGRGVIKTILNPQLL